MNQSILLSALGGLLYQLLPIIESMNDNNEPVQLNSRLFITLPFFTLLGGLAGYLYFEDNQVVNKIMAIHIGMSSPMIFRIMADNIPNFISKMKNDK